VKENFTMLSNILGLLKRYPVLAGFVLMFVCTWPIDLWAAANSHGLLLSLPIPPLLPLFVGYGFVVASLIMTGVISGWAGIRALLRQFLIWRAGLPWYGVVLLGAAAIDLAAIAIHVWLGGAMPDFTQPFARQIVGPSMNLWVALPLFFLIGVFSNGEEIGWRGYALPRLQARHGALIASLIIGVIWAFWHVPKFLTAGSAQDYSFWLYLLDTIAKSILFTWVYNNTKSSLLMVTLFHAAINTSAVFLPIIPAATGDVRPTLIAIGLHGLAAIIVVIVTGPATLSRSQMAQMKAVGEPVAGI
jgi:membrane protease YdiL (CAAX protease family)